MRLVCVLLLALLLPYYLLRNAPDRLEVYVDDYLSLPIDASICLALIALTLSRRSPREKFFWGMIFVSESLWLAAGLLETFASPSWLLGPFSNHLLNDFYLLSYLLVLVAIVSRPDIHILDHAQKHTRLIQSVGTLVLFSGLLIYFGVIPQQSGAIETVSFRAAVLPGLAFFVLCDVFICVRFGYARITTQSRDWRVVYGLLTLVVAGWLVMDSLEFLSYFGSLTLPISGNLLADIPWLIPSFLLMLVVRTRALQTEEVQGRLVEQHGRTRRSSPWGGPLIFYAATLPVVHFIVSRGTILEPSMQTARDLCMLATFVTLVALAYAHQYVLERENRRLEDSQRSTDVQLQLAQRMEAVGRLAGGMAHDFNNMLQVIQACTELQLADPNQNASSRQLLVQTSSAVQRASSLTAQLLTVVRREKNDPKQVDLNEVVSEMGAMLLRVLGDDVALRCNLSEIPPVAFVDRGEVEQVIMNIAINARDAMPEGGELLIQTLVEEDQEQLETSEQSAPHRCVLILSDTGLGMDAETSRHIFEPFFTTKGDTKGTGLGLSVVYGIVQRAGGEVVTQSQLGSGTSFRITLPAADESLTELNVPRPSTSTSDINATETVLVVEDEDFVRDLAIQLLHGLGYRTLSANSGEAALFELRNHGGEVNLLLSDLVMPGMTGPELARLVQQESPTTRILFMSGYSGESWNGAIGVEETLVLSKPFTREELAVMVRRTLDNRPLPDSKLASFVDPS